MLLTCSGLWDPEQEAGPLGLFPLSWGLVLPGSSIKKYPGPSAWEAVIPRPCPRFMLSLEALFPHAGREMMAMGESGIL